ncbi:DUF2975 domain-containing protein [Lysinibacillus sp. 2017]|uniref:DUF2975 domain-containing protein n=1 Tax=unclassified Lysinibacillus TaxID=2636778 RepID=UPI000D527C7F|nr:MULTISPECIES: DUF2975 domain-containing protein [unclassified Lysinibacillus]AWE07183.1 DUF2975 domain-containing protein [Lysinibacillus sp. 2017]TGN34641.1 DUF2975 domain-containing protein [Lysinibacillus sp. S2017]
MQKFNAIILSSVIVLTGIIVLLLCIFVLPSLALETARINPEVAYLQYPILLGMYATALPFFYALYETIMMIQVTERESIFSNHIVQGLNTIKHCAFVIMGLYVVGFSILDYENALPPLIAVMGICIIVITILVATGAAFLKNVLLKNQIEII